MAKQVITSSTALAAAAAINNDPGFNQARTYHLASEMRHYSHLASSGGVDTIGDRELDRSQARCFNAEEMLNCLRAFVRSAHALKIAECQVLVTDALDAQERLALEHGWEFDEYRGCIVDSWGDPLTRDDGLDDIER